MTAPSTALAIFIALVLISAAVHKILARDRLAAAAARLTRTPLSWARGLSFGAAGFEIIAGVMLVVPFTRPAGAGAALVLWTLYALLLEMAARRGEGGLDCGCGFAKHHGGGTFERLRAIFLAALAATVMLLPLYGVARVEPVFAAFALFSLYVAVGELSALSSYRRNLAS